MKRVLKILGVFILVAAFLLSGGVVWVLNDEALLTGRVESFASSALGRQVTIGGLELDLGSVTRVRVDELRLANASWAGESDLIRVERVDLLADISRLWHRELTIQTLVINEAGVNLEQDDSGRGNWRFGTSEPGGSPDRNWVVHWNHVRLDGLSLRHTAPQRREPLEIRVERLTADHGEQGRVDLDGSGSVATYPFDIDGFIDPLHAVVSGGSASFRLFAELGDIRLLSQGSADDLMSGRGASISMKFAGPDFAWILEQAALPEFSGGEFDFNAQLEMAEDGHLNLDVDGDLGEFQANLDARLDRLAKPSQVTLAANLSGPDLEALGQALGVRNLPAAPYTLDGEVMYSQGMTTIERAAASVGPDAVELSGTVGPWPGLDGTELDIEARGPDIRAWGPSIGVDHWKPNSFRASARVRMEQSGLSLERAAVNLGSSRLKFEGILPGFPGLEGAALGLKLSTPDISSIAVLPGVSVPSVPAEVDGRIRRDEQDFHIDRLEVDSGGNHLTLDGLIAWSAASNDAGMPQWPVRLSGTNVHSKIRLADAQWCAELFDLAWAPAEPLDASLDARFEGGALMFKLNEGALGEMKLEIDGLVPHFPRLVGAESRISISLPSLEVLEAPAGISGLPGLPMDIQGTVRRLADGVGLEAVQARVGDGEVYIDGEIVLEPNLAARDMTFRASGSDFRAFYDRAELQRLPGNFSVQAELSTGGVPGETRVSNFAIRLGDSLATGVFTFANRDVPEFRGTVDFNHLDLEWLARPEEAGSRTPPEENDATPAASRFLSDDPLPILGWDPVLIDLDVTSDEIILPQGRLAKARLGLVVSGRSITLQPVEFIAARGGKLSGSVVMKESDGSIQAQFIGRAVDFRLGLLSGKTQDPATFPAWDFDLDLDANGSSPHELAGSATGKLDVVVGRGQILNRGLDLVFSDLISELFSRLNPFAGESEFTRLDCAVAAARFSGGLAKIDPLMFQTDKIVVTSGGEIDLQSEKIDLAFSTRPRKGLGISPGAIINPFIRLGGTMARPALNLDASGAALSGGAAVATGGLSLLGESLFNRFIREQDPCGKVVAELRKMQEEGNEGPGESQQP